MILKTDPYNAFLDHADAPVQSAPTGPLAGSTLAVKDIFDIAGHRTGGGNPHRLAEAEPARETAPAIRALLEAGAHFVGRTQTDELTFSLMGLNAHYPQPVNPAAPARVTGGSSSGSAAAVAGGLADIGIGSDTGGSIRAPASFCGLIGLRTTHGAITLQGAMPLAPSFDTLGWFAKDAETYEKAGRVFFPDRPALSPRILRLTSLDDLLLGEAEAAGYRRMVAAVAAVVGEPSHAPALPIGIDDLYWTFRKLQAHEAWVTHGAWISAGERGLGPGVKERFEYGSTITDRTASQENGKRRLIHQWFGEMLGSDGVLILPTVPGAAPPREASFDELQSYRERALRLLCLSGLTGFPQITLPLGRVSDAPFGISLLGPAGSDMALIGLGKKILEAAKGD